MSSFKRDVRVTGVLYLLLAIFGGAPFFYMQSQILVRGDAVATAANVAANDFGFRLVLVADVIGMTVYVLTALGFFRVFRTVSKEIAATMVVFASVGAALMGATFMSHVGALVSQKDPALLLMFLEMRADSFLIAQVFFGLWLFPMGYLAYVSGLFPKALGVLLMIGCFGYVADLLMHFLFPAASGIGSPIALIPATIAELWMVGYLLFARRRFAAAQAALQ